METLNKEQFEKQKQLADIEMQISTAKSILSSLQISKDEFLKGREKEEKQKLEQLYKNSQGLIDQISENHTEIGNFYNKICSYVSFLEEFQAKTHEIITDLAENSENFQKFVDENTLRLAEWQKDLETKEKQLEIKEKSIKNQQKELDKALKLLEVKGRTLRSSYEALRKQWKK